MPRQYQTEASSTRHIIEHARVNHIKITKKRRKIKESSFVIVQYIRMDIIDYSTTPAAPYKGLGPNGSQGM